MEDGTKESLRTAAEAGDRPSIDSLYSTLPEADRLKGLEAIACGAASRGDTDLLGWCFSEGYRLPASSEAKFDGELYMAAAWGGHIPVFELLLARGLEIDVQYSEAYGDALNVATIEANAPLARWLLDHGHRVDAYPGCRDDCHSIIHTVASRNPSVEMLRLLVDRGVTLQGTGIMIAAAEKGDLPAMELLVPLDGIDLEEKVDWPGWHDRCAETGTALYRAVMKGQEEAVEFLLEHGASKAATDVKGLDCVALAAKLGNEEIIELLDCYAP